MDGHNTKAEGARREGEQAAGGASLRGDGGGDGGGQALPQDSGPSDGGGHALLSVAAQTRDQPQVSPRRTSRLHYITTRHKFSRPAHGVEDGTKLSNFVFSSTERLDNKIQQTTVH